MKFSRSLIAAAIGMTLSTQVNAQDFLPLQGRANGISADGRVVVGERDEQAVFWNSASGSYVVIDPRPDWVGYAVATSANGSVVVGSTRQVLPVNPLSPNLTAFRWSEATGMIFLGPSGSVHSTAAGVSSDGSVVVGSSSDGGGDVAFRWTEPGGSVLLGALPGGVGNSNASGVSGDGSIVVGSSTMDLQGNQHAFRWTEAIGMVDLGLPANAVSSAAHGISADGSTIAGTVTVSARRAHSWTQSEGWVALDMLAGDSNSEAWAVSADGSVIVGRSYGATDSHAVRWDGTEVRTIEQWLSDSGFTRPIGFTLTEATGVNADGTVIVGNWAQGAWLARSGSGLIPDLGAFDAGLAEAGAGLALGVRDQARFGLADLQTRALDAWRADDEAQPCAWVSAGGGAFADELRVDQAHVGGCARIGGAGIALGAGRMQARQNWAEGGKGRIDGYFVAATLSVPIVASLYGSLSLSHASFDANLRREYVNGESIDVSVARPDASVESAEARIAWRSDVQVQGFAWSPYLVWDSMRTEIDPYVENGGGFPAQYDGLRDETQHARLGVDASRAWRRSAVQFSLEAVRRLDEGPGLVVGRVPGLYDFARPIETTDRNWMQLRVGTRSPVGERGSLAFDVQTATAGDDARWGLGLAYRMAF